MEKAVVGPRTEVTSLGSAIFAFLAAGTFRTLEDAQDALCPTYRTIEPDPAAAKVYDELYALYRKLYFSFGIPGSEPGSMGDILPALRRIAAQASSRPRS